MRPLLIVLTLSLCFGQPVNVTATAVAEMFKARNLFPKANKVTDITSSLSPQEKQAGVLSIANVESSTVNGVTIKVFRSIKERNAARLQMVNKCPGCNFLAECGVILVYTPTMQDREINKILNSRSTEYYIVMSRQYKCE